MDIRNPYPRTAKHGYIGNHLVYFPSRKNKCQLTCNSMLEADYCINLEYDPEVESYTSEVAPINVVVMNKLLKYKPDFLIKTRESTNYIEVKITFRDLSYRSRLKLDNVRDLLEAEGTPLRYANLESIRDGQKFNNKKFLYFNSFNVRPDELGFCLKVLSEVSYPTTLSEIMSKPRIPSLRALYLAIFNGKLKVDLNKKLSLHSVILKGPD